MKQKSILFTALFAGTMLISNGHCADNNTLKNHDINIDNTLSNDNDIVIAKDIYDNKTTEISQKAENTIEEKNESCDETHSLYYYIKQSIPLISKYVVLPLGIVCSAIWMFKLRQQYKSFPAPTKAYNNSTTNTTDIITLKTEPLANSTALTIFDSQTPKGTSYLNLQSLYNVFNPYNWATVYNVFNPHNWPTLYNVFNPHNWPTVYGTNSDQMQEVINKITNAKTALDLERIIFLDISINNKLTQTEKYLLIKLIEEFSKKNLSDAEQNEFCKFKTTLKKYEI